jgi:predicted metal-dependent phosphoesterase TrpH
MQVDLHIHTTASDGRWPPERVISEAVRAGIGFIAVTDHDTIGSVKACQGLAAGAGLFFLRGVEISSAVQGQVFHILGYGFDLDHPGLGKLLAENTEKLDRADDRIVESLVERGYNVDPAEYAAYTYERTRGGWKVLNYLIDRGLCADVADYLERVGRGQTPPSFPQPKEVIATIREAGGEAILAHPLATMEGMRISEEMLPRFLQWGISGLECYHPEQDEEETALCLEWCDRENLLITGGSDCHGGLVGREIGVPPVTLGDLRLGKLERWLEV